MEHFIKPCFTAYPRLTEGIMGLLSMQNSNKHLDQFMNTDLVQLLQPTRKLETPQVLRKALVDTVGTVTRYSKSHARAKSCLCSHGATDATLLHHILSKERQHTLKTTI